MEEWSPYARVYDPLMCGSIDGTDTEPHDKAIVRAQNSHYEPPTDLTNKAENTILVARLNRDTNEATLKKHFARYGDIQSLTIVRNIVTGFSQGYGFIEYTLRSDADEAKRDAHQSMLDGKQLIIEREVERTLPDWIPRRLGGGFGGKKESGQLRFGCRERPFRKPINVSNNETDSINQSNRSDTRNERDRVRFDDRVERDKSRRPRDRSRRSRDRSRDRRRSRDRSADRSRKTRDRSRERRRSRDRSVDKFQKWITNSGSREKRSERHSVSPDRQRNRSRSKERYRKMSRSKESYRKRSRSRDRDRDSQDRKDRFGRY